MWGYERESNGKYPNKTACVFFEFPIITPSQKTNEFEFCLSFGTEICFSYAVGIDMNVNVQGSLFYRDCILVDTNVVEGCQQNVIGPMEKAALQELGLSNANVTITNFQGSTCLSAPLDDSRELSTGGSC